MKSATSRLQVARTITQCCLGTGGLAALTTLAPEAQGVIVVTDILDVTLQYPFEQNPDAATDIFIDLGSALVPGSATLGSAAFGIPLETDFRFSFNNDAAKPYIKGPVPGDGGNNSIANTGVEANGPFGNIGGRFASKLGTGETVETQDFTMHPTDTGVNSTAYIRTPTAADSQWAVGDTGFLGLKFDLGFETHYGWAQITLHEASVTVHSFAYNDTPFDGITAGQIPEPHSMVLLALGAGGLATLRRRRASQPGHSPN